MKSVNLDTYDLAILRNLQDDGRVPWVTLAERINLSPTACQRRVRLLEEAGVIRAYGARIDLAKLGFGVEAFVAVHVERQSTALARKFREAVLAYPEVQSCHLLSGDTDFMLRVIAPDLSRFGGFIQDKILNLPGIKDASSLIVLETIKDGATVPDT
ncbi:MAG: Lrp/AsnC family transcriptional regulator [Pseudomonadota bacterium]